MSKLIQTTGHRRRVLSLVAVAWCATFGYPNMAGPSLVISAAHAGANAPAVDSARAAKRAAKQKAAAEQRAAQKAQRKAAKAAQKAAAQEKKAAANAQRAAKQKAAAERKAAQQEKRRAAQDEARAAKQERDAARKAAEEAKRAARQQAAEERNAAQKAKRKAAQDAARAAKQEKAAARRAAAEAKRAARQQATEERNAAQKAKRKAAQDAARAVKQEKAATRRAAAEEERAARQQAAAERNAEQKAKRKAAQDAARAAKQEKAAARRAAAEAKRAARQQAAAERNAEQKAKRKAAQDAKRDAKQEKAAARRAAAEEERAARQQAAEERKAAQQAKRRAARQRQTNPAVRSNTVRDAAPTQAPRATDQDRRIRNRDVTQRNRAQRRRDRQRQSTQPIRRAQDQRLDRIRAQRRRKRAVNGGTILQEPDGRSIVRRGRRSIIRSQDSNRIRRRARSARSALRRDGGRVSTVTRRNGTKIVSVFDRNGNLVRRVRRGPRGRKVVLFDNRPVQRHRHRKYRRRSGFPFLLELAAPVITIPLAKYIVDARYSHYDDIYYALDAPPIEDVDAAYTLDEVRYNHALRARMRRVDINTINFDTGSWHIDEYQFDKLSSIARALKRILKDRPDEVFLIEGHTDAIGSDDDNLSLSDRRAESVAIILSEEFDVPPENLTTQGYGEQFLKVRTYRAERKNRRVSIRRITPMLRRDKAKYEDDYADLDPEPTEYQADPYFDRDRLFEFVNDRYFVSYDLSSTAMRDLYASRVDHFGKRNVPISDVIRDKQNYYNRWPYRTYEIDRNTFRVDPGDQPGLYDVSFEYTFDVRGSSRRSRGRGVTQLTLRQAGRTFQIESEGGKVLDRF